MTKKVFLEKLKLIDTPTIQELTNCDTLNTFEYCIKIYGLNYKGEYAKDNYFYTEFCSCNKWSGDEKYEKYLIRTTKMKEKYFRWFRECSNGKYYFIRNIVKI